MVPRSVGGSGGPVGWVGHGPQGSLSHDPGPSRLIDPFTTSDVRGVVVKSLAALAKEGRVVKQGAGLYQARPD